MPDSSGILLDTHIFIWLLNGEPKKFKKSTLTLIEEKAKTTQLKVSAISIWEIGMLESKSRISFNKNCLDWVNQALSAPGISLVPISPEITIESSRLPSEFQGDPADRIIISTARRLGATLVTADQKILSYGKKGHVRVLKP